MSVLRAEGISKSFRAYGSEWRRMLSWFGRPDASRDERHILHDINFSVEAGEAVGIVGQNGAGKSTLLKIMAGTMQPTSGTVHREGRIAALLELGMGFNPEMTGRANVLNTAGLMGFSQEKILAAMDGIEDFAEIGDYFDEPLHVYSSGMQVRLAFAVATAFRPQVLIVDEALSVGDSYFQHKSFARIREFREAGTTLLLVSHDRGAVATLCNRAILIDRGTLRMDGPPENVLDLYNAIIAEKEGSRLTQQQARDGRVQTLSGTGEARITVVELLDGNGNPTEMLKVGEPAALRVEVAVDRSIPELVVGYMIKDRLGQPVFGINTFYLDHVERDLAAGEKVSYTFRFDATLGAGHYSVAVALHQGPAHVSRNYEWRDLALTFSVVNASHPAFVGIAWVPPTVDIQR
ncbi:MAG: ABC transporter ATP-binding protein [Pseudochelatococcus sp.]|jgi:lipopolysaccharide transport system ATP-binding protein|uniref:ABC transporter ATP-binding protein n=1 Tax=Pseudochelatococcus sp. TaxID=2020869 RepID=UPI003D9125F2